MDINTYSTSTHTTHQSNQPHRGTERGAGTIEWWGTDVGGNRTTIEPVTGGQGHRWRMWPRHDSDWGLIWLLVAQEATSPITTLTPPGMDNPPAAPQQQPQQLQPRRQCHSNTNTSNGGCTHPHHNSRGQPRTAHGSHEKTPGALQALVDQQTLDRGGGGGCGLLPCPNCGDAYQGELALVLNP